MAINPELFMTP